ncbi:unnamed protein product [Polarella glacialis]|uniref:Methyltransferase FkbM domain-containing protein n=1 Tax=Polarella glacialis TaxID=89957 RepID=A0A813LAD1_POLGL|nr:unnamed protein product [Polarella glacialis]
MALQSFAARQIWRVADRRLAAVPIQTLDDALKKVLPWAGGPVHAIKMDVEGFECEVLRGGDSLFQMSPKPFFLWVELMPRMVACDPQSFIKIMKGKGYMLLEFAEKGSRNAWFGSGETSPPGLE